MNANKLSAADRNTNTVRLSLGSALVVLEVTRGSSMAVRHTGRSDRRPVTLDAAREEIATLRGLGWQVAAA